MSGHVLTLAAMMMAAFLAGCAESPEQAIDDDYRRGYISAADRQRLMEESTGKRLAATEARMREFQQQPYSNPNYEKRVGPQPAEHPFHPGRPIDETAGW